MIKSSYGHPLLSMYLMKDTRRALEEEYAYGKLKSVDKAPFVKLLTNEKSGDIKQFNHPLMLDHMCVVDGRTFSKVNNDGELIITNSAQYEINVWRGILEYAWQQQRGVEALMSVMKVPAKLYGHWVSESLARALGLGIEATGQLSILCYMYFWCQFREFKGNVIDEDLAQPQMVKFVTNASGISSEYVVRMLDVLKSDEDFSDGKNIKSFDGDGEFAEACRIIGIKEISGGDIIRTVLANSWQGSSARELSILAVSYPPAFMAMIVSAQRDRAFRNTPISKLLDRFRRSIDAEQWVKQLRGALHSAISEYNQKG